MNENKPNKPNNVEIPNKIVSLLKTLFLNMLIFMIVFMGTSYFFMTHPMGQNNLHNVAQKAADEKYKKEKENKNSKLYRYNSDKFIEDIYTIAKNEAEKGNFYLEINKPFTVTDDKIKYITDTKGLKVTDYYTVEDIKEYVEDDTKLYLEKVYGIELETELVDIHIRW